MYQVSFICEQLPVDLCAYSIATSGQRCLQSPSASAFWLDFAQMNAIKLAPNIVDLYSNMALGEGTYLPTLCANPCRAKHQARSNGDAAPASGTVAQAPEAAIFGRC
ncbi:hypothetical protein OIU84_025112 [Salix udensis]|uniref:Uncharacterized protein n=1 Tax=Salix udensis TaxID=889485 RepID=A0AAD6KK46_9ROSI|nr:hypothetical protein OIU84_025112 [Salix udensis]